jgi:signal transduction histidine kinase
MVTFAMISRSSGGEFESHYDAKRACFALEAVGVGTWDYYPDRDELYWDARCREIFALPPEVKGTYRDFIAAIHPDDRAKTTEPSGCVLAKSDDYRVEYRILGVSDGVVRWVSVRGRVFSRDAEGRVTRIVGTVLDITERKALELARETFLGIVGHDLRTPLNVIMVGARLLLESEQSSPYDRAITERIAASAERMTSILQDLLDLTQSRLGGGITIARAPADMNTICQRVIEELAMAHPSREIHFALEGDPAGRWDAGRVMQALSNLVGNAIVHGEDPIVVRVRGEPDAVVVEVENRGKPIPKEKLTTIFEPFERGLEAHAKTGIGLGLYIASQLARSHGGAIGVTSDERRTVFTTRWPREG